MKANMRDIVVAGLAVGLFAADGTRLRAQHPVDKTEWTVSPLRTSGQPVIPIFDGWYQNPDGTYQLCFGYYNLNSEEVLDIPLGPDNFIEPRHFDGGQPTHFMLSDAAAGYMRHWCVFTVKVPKDFGTQWDRPRVLKPGENNVVFWTIRRNGRSYTVPGHLGSPNYELDEPSADARKVTAPVVRFEPTGPEGRGRNGVFAGPLRVAAGQPLTVSVSVRAPDGRPAKWWVGWGTHQGPGKVSFNEQGTTLKEGAGLATTTATFSEPGEYLLRVQAIESTESFEFHCCWTNGFVRVTVTP